MLNKETNNKKSKQGCYDMEEYKICEKCGGSGKGEKMLDMQMYHQCTRCAGRGKYYDVKAITEQMPAELLKIQSDILSKLLG